MKLIWCSDIHLNFIEAKNRAEFYDKLKETSGDIIVITGDIAESNNLKSILIEMIEAVDKPIYYVLGNHDFYGSSVNKVYKLAKTVGNWIPKNSGTKLSDSTVLLGVDGWADCRNGNFENSKIVMSDWLYIDDLRFGYGKGRQELKKAIQLLSDRDAKKLKRAVNKVLDENISHIIIATHIPPFKEACLHAGRKSTEDGLPFFSSQILGNTILPIINAHPEVKFTWLCGHTHSRVILNAAQNLEVRVAKADYYYPKIEEVIEYDI